MDNTWRVGVPTSGAGLGLGIVRKQEQVGHPLKPLRSPTGPHFLPFLSCLTWESLNPEQVAEGPGSKCSSSRTGSIV